MAALIAHRGFSGRQPEMTRAAYEDAIAWSAATGTPLGLECDVHFSADDELICLHDLRLDRTSNGRGPAYAKTLAQLRRLDFGRWRVARPTPQQRALVTLTELLDLVDLARAAGTEVSAVIETKHPNPRGAEVEVRVAELLRDRGWDLAGSPVRVITFDVAALGRLAELLPEVPRSFLIEKQFGVWTDGSLPDGARSVSPDLELIRADPDYVRRALGRGHEVGVWTVNEPADVRRCRELGVSSFTTDVPDVVAAVLAERGSRG